MPEPAPFVIGESDVDAAPHPSFLNLDAQLDGGERAISHRPGVLRRLLANPLGFAALCVLVFVHLAVFLGPFIWTASPTGIDPVNMLTGPSSAHPLGADDLGRDVLSRLLHGGQVTLIVGLVSMSVLVVIGVLVGAIAAYAGGWTDTVLMRLTDAMMAIPTFFLVLVALTVLPKNIPVISIVIAAGTWMQVTRVVYGDTLRWKKAEFVEAAHAIGMSHTRILRKHIIPQIYPAIIVSATLGIAYAILTETAISYLGLGIQPPLPSWGNMLQSAQAYVWTAPSLAIYPGLVISIVVLAYNILGDSLRDVLDPRISR
jgi:peptide/nickel transport system permease protein